MNRAYNFGAGPAMLPDVVLQQAQEEMLDWHGTGMSVVEVSHRSAAFMELVKKAEQDFRELLSVPDNYKVLFLSGPTRAQFALIPQNLIGKKSSADYIQTGIWSEMAAIEGQKYLTANVIASTKDDAYTTVPQASELNINPDAAFCHYTSNETVNGVEFPYIPDSGDVPLVVDMTSSILSRPVDVSRYGIIYAGAQKNIAPAGLVILIVREDLFDRASAQTPTFGDFAVQLKNESLYYTPSSFSIYIAGLVFQWLKASGGLSAMADINQRKAKKLYDFIDQHDFYQNPVEKSARSLMNVPFTLADDQLDATFVKQADAANLKALKGHRFVGGMRASIYNAMPEAGVDALISFMQDFAAQHG